MKLDQEKVQIAADHLAQGFIWSDTPEGYDYWHKVYNNLRELGAEEMIGSPDLPFPHLESCKIFLDTLPAAFTWHNTRLGEEYWSGIFTRVVEIYNVAPGNYIAAEAETKTSSQVSNTISLKDISK